MPTNKYRGYNEARKSLINSRINRSKFDKKEYLYSLKVFPKNYLLIAKKKIVTWQRKDLEDISPQLRNQS